MTRGLKRPKPKLVGGLPRAIFEQSNTNLSFDTEELVSKPGRRYSVDPLVQHTHEVEGHSGKHRVLRCIQN